MKKANNQPNTLLPLNTKIEVVAIKGDRILKNIMTLEEAFKMRKTAGWSYYNYQIGFCSMKATE